MAKFKLTPEQVQIRGTVLQSSFQRYTLIEALAGTGKTSTNMMVVNEIPRTSRVLLCAFNRSIANELTDEITENKWGKSVKARTIHGLGRWALRHNEKNFSRLGFTGTTNWKPFNGKYTQILKQKIVQNPWPKLVELQKVLSDARNKLQFFQSDSPAAKLQRETLKAEIAAARFELRLYLRQVKELIATARQYLVIDADQLKTLAKELDINLLHDAAERAIDIVLENVTNLHTIDHSDTLFLPWYHVTQTKLFELPGSMYHDYVFIDEAQDLSNAQRWMSLSCVKPKTGRGIIVGDRNQAIYAFAGANCKSFSEFEKLPAVKKLPLTTNWRCGNNIINAARKLVPSINPAPTAIDGYVGPKSYLEARPGDMVIARLTSSLIRGALDLLGKGVPAMILGKSLANEIMGPIKETKAKDMPTAIKQLNEEMEQYGEGSSEYDNYKRILKVINLINPLNNKSITVFAKELDKLFEDKVTSDKVVFLTAHKSKGLENKNIFIMDFEMFGFIKDNLAATADAKQQEDNLLYVAITRAKENLFIDYKNKEKYPHGMLCSWWAGIKGVTQSTIEQEGNDASTFNPLEAMENDAIQLAKKIAGFTI